MINIIIHKTPQAGFSKLIQAACQAGSIKIPEYVIDHGHWHFGNCSQFQKMEWIKQAALQGHATVLRWWDAQSRQSSSFLIFFSQNGCSYSLVLPADRACS
ncbi:hypothetical protein BCR44DRAFT_1428550 [Catenaria anguillulae PL171]|uniref:Uncharacterized protein n=1 Tax=Catenaria anguillulae PL171 TaxID=765915 RepID=A0A1Y2HVF4_9FUNG|nr:hypothetical protein BCR44DRAFT_1428550 [Catenaria anguillulae PL171]